MGSIAETWMEASEVGSPVLLSQSELESACRWHLVALEDHRADMAQLDRNPSDAGNLVKWLGY